MDMLTRRDAPLFVVRLVAVERLDGSRNTQRLGRMRASPYRTHSSYQPPQQTLTLPGPRTQPPTCNAPLSRSIVSCLLLPWTPPLFDSDMAATRC